MIRAGGAMLFVLGLALAASADGPRLDPQRVELSDGKLPLWELKPMDRRVYVVSLDGDWKKPPRPGAAYALNVRFPDGSTYAHRPINEELFFKGEMRFMVPDYLLVRTQAAKGGRLTFFVTEKPSAGARAETISSSMDIDWPIKRRIVTQPPSTKFTPPKPVDAFPLSGEGKKE